MDTQITVPQERTYFLSPAVDVASAVARYQAMSNFIKQVLHDKIDFGTVPGSDKPTLLKPGAEKLAAFFGLNPRFILVDHIEDWAGQDHGGEPFFYYRYKCQLYQGEKLIAEGEGSCNSWEKKYRYRQAERVCPNCGKSNIRRSKDKATGKPAGWYCWAKTGGCGATFSETDKSIVDQETGQVKNPDPAEQVNTMQKMAQKRSLVAPILIATNASEYFTQDIEDFAQSGDFVDVSASTSNGTPPEPESQANTQPASDVAGQTMTYTGPQARIGKNLYPTTWAQLLMKNLANLGGNIYEIDGILQKLALPQETAPAKVLEKIETYLAEKSS